MNSSYEKRKNKKRLILYQKQINLLLNHPKQVTFQQK